MFPPIVPIFLICVVPTCKGEHYENKNCTKEKDLCADQRCSPEKLKSKEEQYRKKKENVLIIGSGMGGLCTGALLAHSGYKTLVLERLPIIGGRFSTRAYRGYKISTGGVYVQMGGPVEGVFKEVGAELEVRISPQDFYFSPTTATYNSGSAWL
jgi:NADPH-dependent 2,4-dienoyl-CoA reductase/sulfur reductase-like enzyme